MTLFEIEEDTFIVLEKIERFSLDEFFYDFEDNETQLINEQNKIYKLGILVNKKVYFYENKSETKAKFNELLKAMENL